MSQSTLAQASLSIGRPNDRYEEEADRVADLVMRMAEPRLQRQVEPEDEEEEETLQTQKSGAQTPRGGPSVQAQMRSLRGRGQPLPESERRFFESRLGHNFDEVRLHVDSRAGAAARALNARAFTRERDIVFAPGQFAPGTRTGKRLLAHELTHVVQQCGSDLGTAAGEGGRVQRESPRIIVPPRPRTKFTPPRLPKITFPSLTRVESIPQAASRLLNEFRTHVKGGQVDKAKALVPKIKTYVMGTSMSWDFAIPTAEAFLSIGLTKDAFEVLEDARKQHIYGHHRTRFSMKAASRLLKDGRAALNRKDPDTAYLVFVKLLRWLDKPEFHQKSRLAPLSTDWFVKETRRDAVTALMSVVDYYLVPAEEAYKTNDPNAPVLLAKAKATLDRLKADLKDLPGLRVAVAEPKLTKPGSETAEYTDVQDPKLKVKVKQYPGANFPNYFGDRIRRLETILETKTKQVESVKGFYEGDKAVVALYERKRGKRPDIHKLADRRRFWELKYDYLIGQRKSRRDALQALMDSVGGYLEAFTIHTKYDIPDARTDALTAEFPRTTTRQALMDCGIFAMRTAYELSLIRRKASLDFYFVFMPIHVGVGIIDKDKAFGWALHNNQISPIKQDIGKEGVARAVGRYFGYVPAPVEAVKLRKLSGRRLRKALQAGPDELFVPVNYGKLRGEARREAAETGKRIKARYRSLKERLVTLTRESTYHLMALRDKHKDMAKGKPEEYRRIAINRIEGLYPTYAKLSAEIVSFYRELVRFREGGLPRNAGVPTSVTPSIGVYYQNTYYMLRYLAYVLGKKEFATKKYVDRPIYSPADKDYKGAPPPWEKGIFDLVED